jgi:hypothetical protein
MSWVGWLKRTPNASWQRVCQGSTLPQCAARLRRAAEALGIPQSRTVLTGGAAPYSPTAREVRLARRRPG